MSRLFLAILLVAVFYGVYAGHCCHYPLSSYGITSANVTYPMFNCSEPIAISCQLSSPGVYQEVAIAGRKKDVEKFDNLATDSEQVEKTLVCDTSAQMWHLEGSTAEYVAFVCGYKRNGEWIYAS